MRTRCCSHLSGTANITSCISGAGNCIRGAPHGVGRCAVGCTWSLPYWPSRRSFPRSCQRVGCRRTDAPWWGLPSLRCLLLPRCSYCHLQLVRLLRAVQQDLGTKTTTRILVRTCARSAFPSTSVCTHRRTEPPFQVFALFGHQATEGCAHFLAKDSLIRIADLRQNLLIVFDQRFGHGNAITSKCKGCCMPRHALHQDGFPPRGTHPLTVSS